MGVDSLLPERAAAGLLHALRRSKVRVRWTAAAHKRLGGNGRKVDGPGHHPQRFRGRRPMRLGTSSPTTMEKYSVISTTTSPGGALAAKRHGHTQCSKPQRQRPAKAASTTRTFRTPIDVMPMDGGEKTRGVFAQLHGGAAPHRLINQFSAAGLCGAVTSAISDMQTGMRRIGRRVGNFHDGVYGLGKGASTDSNGVRAQFPGR